MNEFMKLVGAVGEAQTLALKLRTHGVKVLSADVIVCIDQERPSVHLGAASFEGLKSLYGWQTSTIPYSESEKYSNDKEFIILGGVEVFTLRERAKEAV